MQNEPKKTVKNNCTKNPHPYAIKKYLITNKCGESIFLQNFAKNSIFKNSVEQNSSICASIFVTYQ